MKHRTELVLRCGAHALAALPAALLVHGAWTDQLGADPVAALVHRTGWWALTLLLVCLAMTPLRRLSGSAVPIRFRRLLGLWSFAYASAHLACFAVFDLGLDLGLLGAEIGKRPYILVGFSAWLLLIPLALTSTRGMMRRLGRRWVQLHRLVYLVAALGVLHFWWQVKADIAQPALYAAILAVLLAARLRVPRAADKT